MEPKTILLNVFLVVIILFIVIYLFNSITKAQRAGVLADTRVDRQPQRQHNYYLKSHRVATWMPPWFRRNPPLGGGRPRCPRGCRFSGRAGSQDQRGFSCPNGQNCHTSDCCKYDRDCINC